MYGYPSYGYGENSWIWLIVIIIFLVLFLGNRQSYPKHNQCCNN